MGVAVTTYPTNAQDASESRWRLMGLRRGETGVFYSYGNKAEVTPVSGMVTSLASGSVGICGIDGEWDDAVNLTHNDAHATFNRYDLIVASLHLDTTPFEIQLEIVQGNNAATPSIPSPRNTSTNIDCPIAAVYVGATASAITTDDITMRRRWFPSVTDFGVWTPTWEVTSGSSFSLASATTTTAEYRLNGALCEFYVDALIKLTGSNPGGLQFSLPARAQYDDVPFVTDAFNNNFRCKLAYNPVSGYNDVAQINRGYLDPADDPDGYQKFPTNAVTYGVRVSGQYRIRS